MIERLQSRTPADREPCTPRVCGLDSESATDVVDAIASDTARSILVALHEEPRPVSQLAEELDMSIPSINYHREKLEDAGLISVVDTWYSNKGNEMAVYGPTDDPLVFVGDDEQTDLVRSAVTRVGAAILAIAAVSVVIQWFVTEFLPAQGPSTVRKAASAGTVEGTTVILIPPGLLFFSGGTFVLALALTIWYLRARTQRRGPAGTRPPSRGR